MNRVLLLCIIACFGCLAAAAGLLTKFVGPGALATPAVQAGVTGAVAADAPVPPTAPASLAPIANGRAAVLRPDQAGQFHADVTVNGRTIRMLVDTGATLVALTQQDAITLGVLPMTFNVPVQTAAGQARAGEAKLAEVRIGNVQVRDINALVLPPGVTGQSLLGMSFLRRLSGFEFSAGNLVLKQ